MRPLIVLAMMVAGCATPQPSGPDAAQLSRLIAAARPGTTPQVRGARCDFIEEEGSEWACSYEQRASDGRWVELHTLVAANGGGWTLIDAVEDPDRPEAGD